MKNAGDFDGNPPVQVIEYDNSMTKFCAGYQQIATMTHACLQAKLPKKAKIMIVGAGTGAELCEMAPGNSEWEFTGIDPSREMLSVAEKKLSGCNVKNVKLVCGYVGDLVDQEEYDAATCILVMHFLADDGSKLNLLKDISMRMKKGGTFVLVDAVGDKNEDEFQQLLEAWKRYPVCLGEDETFVKDGFEQQILKRSKFVSEERIQQLLEEAGFARGKRFYTGFLYGGWMTQKVK